mmetsp:Transcript_67735/g.180356  ORF Transcript_67735/g.180356 Transcript_67735/m.180356 type:complete len:258 (+) Transcript_67735:105-878(+)
MTVSVMGIWPARSLWSYWTPLVTESHRRWRRAFFVIFSKTCPSTRGCSCLSSILSGRKRICGSSTQGSPLRVRSPPPRPAPRRRREKWDKVGVLPMATGAQKRQSHARGAVRRSLPSLPEGQTPAPPSSPLGQQTSRLVPRARSQRRSLWLTGSSHSAPVQRVLAHRCRSRTRPGQCSLTAPDCHWCAPPSRLSAAERRRGCRTRRGCSRRRGRHGRNCIRRWELSGSSVPPGGWLLSFGGKKIRLARRPCCGGWPV